MTPYEFMCAAFYIAVGAICIAIAVVAVFSTAKAIINFKWRNDNDGTSDKED